MNARNRKHQTLLYIWAWIIVFATALIGFYSYYLNLALHLRPRQGMEFAHPHALMMTAWCLLFLMQVILARTGRLTVHRRLGLMGTLLLAAIVLDGISTSIIAIQTRRDHLFGPPAPFFALLLALLFNFAALAAAGIAYRNRPQIHKRLMLMSLLSLVPAGLIRIQFHPLFIAFPAVLILVTNLCIIAAILWDYRLTGKFHPAFRYGFAFIIAFQAVTMVVATNQHWGSYVASTFIPGRLDRGY